MKKIVIVSSLQVFPALSGGQLRTANFALALADLGYEVCIYSLTGRKNDYVTLKKSSTEKITNQISEFVHRNIIFGLIQKIFYLCKLPPVWIYWILKFYCPTDLKTKISNSSLLIADFPFVFEVFRFTNNKKWLNTHNAEFELWKSNQFISKYVKSIEEKAMLAADLVLFCSTNDLEKFNHLAINNKSVLLTNGVRTQYVFKNENEKNEFKTQIKIPLNKKVFIFTGSQFGPNKQAYNFLKSFAEINKNTLIKNNILIMVAGSVCDEVKATEYFKTTGQVNPMDTYLSVSDFGLNPVTEGSGVNVKMMEYLNIKLPILSTKVGARGLYLKDQDHFFEFNHDNFLEKLLLALNTESDKIKQMSELAYVDNYHLLNMVKQLNVILKEREI